MKGAFQPEVKVLEREAVLKVRAWPRTRTRSPERVQWSWPRRAERCSAVNSVLPVRVFQ